MGRRGDDGFDMEERFTPEVVDDILSGRPVTQPLAAELGAVLGGLHLLRQEPSSEVASRHLAAMTAAAAAIGPQPVLVARRERRRRMGVTPRWALVSSIVGALTLTTGLAAAGALPGPAQRAVSSVAHTFGLGVSDGATHEPSSDVASVARDRSLAGCEHGEAVSDLAQTQHDDSSSTEPSTTEPSSTEPSSTEPSAPDKTCATHEGSGSGSPNASQNRGHTDITSDRRGGTKGSVPGGSTDVRHHDETTQTENEPATTESTEVSGKGIHPGGGKQADTTTTTAAQTQTQTTSTTPTTTSGGGGSGGGGK